METFKTLIQGFQKALSTHSFEKPMSFSEEFAQARFKKKFEEPNADNATNRKTQCWVDWLERDEALPQSLPLLCTLPGKWLNVGEFLKRNLSPYKPGPLKVSGGSEFTATNGRNSLEAKLARKFWDVTPEAFPRFARLCYSHHGLKKAVKVKFNTWIEANNYTRRVVNQHLYNHFKSSRKCNFEIFEWKLKQLCKFQVGSRFGTVPKNNLVDRPINIECFGNMLLQLQYGQFLRAEIKRLFGVNLDTLAEEHRRRISNLAIATIDLSNASDCVALSLVSRVLPPKHMELIHDIRSQFVLGPDDNAYLIRKVSAMGCGFTFELMTLLLLTLCRFYDKDSTVFGDDIIIDSSKARDVMRDLESVGMQVNFDKSFIEGDFRESCGANWHAVEGYVVSYDITWPTDIHDCMTVYNKIKHLSLLYPSFKQLERSLFRRVPKALRGASVDTNFHKYYEAQHFPDELHFHNDSLDESAELSNWFRCGSRSDFVPNSRISAAVARKCSQLQRDVGDVTFHYGVIWEPKLRTKTVSHLSSRNQYKYLAYLFAGIRTKDVITGSGRWVKTLYVCVDGKSQKLKTFLHSLSEQSTHNIE